MNVLIRCYKSTDLDLCALAAKMGRKFSPFVRSCLCAFIKNTPIDVVIPPIDFIPDYTTYPTSVKIGVRLDETVDADVIEMLNNIQNRRRNNFIKTVIRQYIDKSACLAYCNNPYLFSKYIGMHGAATHRQGMNQMPALQYQPQPMYPYAYFSGMGYPMPVAQNQMPEAPLPFVQRPHETQEVVAVKEKPKPRAAQPNVSAVPHKAEPKEEPKPMVEAKQKEEIPKLTQEPEPEEFGSKENTPQRQISDGEMRMFDIFSNML